VSEASALDLALLRRAFRLASEARARGDRPFAAIIAQRDGTILAEGLSAQGRAGRGTLAHSEMMACQAVIDAKVPRELLQEATIYSSGEPCAMCAAAIFYTGLGRAVYGLSAGAILHLRNATPATAGLSLSCRAVLETAAETVEVHGPLLEGEGAVPHAGYWAAG
jgi:tRNA(Arg) A34 adenosine deaminase TadA